jgi:hypothetical protein
MKTAKLALSAAGVALLLVLISQFSEISAKRTLERARMSAQQPFPQQAGSARMQAPDRGYGQAPGSMVAAGNGERDTVARQAEIEGLVAARLNELENRFGAAAEVNAVKDAELARLQEELAILQEERVMMSKQIDQIETAKVVERQIEEQSLTDSQRRIRRAVPIAKVLAFEKQYGFVTLDAGKTQMLAEGSKLAIRRGDDVVAELKVATVDLDTAVADVIDFKADPPKAGDEVIAWPF